MISRSKLFLRQKKISLKSEKISVVGFRTNLNFRHSDISRLTERGTGRIALRITAAYREILQEKNKKRFFFDRFFGPTSHADIQSKNPVKITASAQTFFS